MSIRCQTWVYEHSEATGNERLVLLAIADEADNDGLVTPEGLLARVQCKARLTQYQTDTAFQALVDGGHLVAGPSRVRVRMGGAG